MKTKSNSQVCTTFTIPELDRRIRNLKPSLAVGFAAAQFHNYFDIYKVDDFPFSFLTDTTRALCGQLSIELGFVPPRLDLIDDLGDEDCQHNLATDGFDISEGAVHEAAEKYRCCDDFLCCHFVSAMVQGLIEYILPFMNEEKPSNEVLAGFKNKLRFCVQDSYHHFIDGFKTQDELVVARCESCGRSEHEHSADEPEVFQ